MDTLVLLGSFFLFMIVGVPVAYSLGLAALAGALWIELPLDAVMIQIASGVNKFSLLAIPFFVLAGAIMAEGGMSRRLVAFAAVLVGFIRGGLSLVNILASTFFGAISGSSVADTASIGSVLIPEMERKGYPRDFATAVTVSGSVQAILIPPSHNAVIYSLAAGGGVSIGALFMAGVMPGLLLGLTLAILCLFIAKKRNFPKGEVIPLKQALKICVDALWGLITMVIILGGILIGVFTATESASIAVVWAFFVTMFIYRDYKWRDLPKLVHRTVKTVSIVMILIGFAAAFGYLMTLMQIPLKVTAFFSTLSDNRYVILMMINVLLLALGTLMDMAPLILILTPILLPMVVKLGVDPVHFGMIMMVNLGIGLLTPPVGAVLFVGSAVAKLKIEAVVKALYPFFGAMLLVLAAGDLRAGDLAVAAQPDVQVSTAVKPRVLLTHGETARRYYYGAAPLAALQAHRGRAAEPGRCAAARRRARRGRAGLPGDHQRPAGRRAARRCSRSCRAWPCSSAVPSTSATSTFRRQCRRRPGDACQPRLRQFGRGVDRRRDGLAGPPPGGRGACVPKRRAARRAHGPRTARCDARHHRLRRHRPQAGRAGRRRWACACW